MNRLSVPACVVGLMLASAILGGCSKQLIVVPVPNEAPTVRLTTGPIDTTEVCRPRPGINCYSLLLRWVGFDPDGRVDYYAYTVDPPDQGDTTWIATTEKEKKFVFEADDGGGRGPDSLTLAHGYHVVVLRAVDNRGASSEPVVRAFFSWTTAPRVQIVNPRPRHGPAFLPPSVRISWQGFDDDASNPGKRPVRYKYLLYGPGNNTIPGGTSALIGNTGPLIRRAYAPEFRAEDGWTTVSADTTSAQFADLVPGASYFFMVVAFDESGAYSPVFELTTSVLYFTVGFATALGPTMTIFNDTFYYKYLGPTYNPENEVRVDVPAGQRISISWSATPPPGADIVAYQWMLDGDVFDERRRVDEELDLRNWSAPSSGITTAMVGPFQAGDHFFYARALDNTGLKALATVHFRCVAPVFDRPLLVVDDTRRGPDSYLANGTPQVQSNPWPSAAEIDTFFYAVGGVQWRNAPAGVKSQAGILAGYAFDTLGTRLASAEGALPLATLARYSHVIWISDFESGRNTKTFTSPVDPMNLLNYMSAQGHVNTLTAYIHMGGEVWMVGGGGCMATMYRYNSFANDGIFTNNFRAGGSGADLFPGTFMYDITHWRSEIADLRYGIGINPTGNFVRTLGRFTFHPGVYADVPAAFDARSTTSDPLPPMRTSSQFYTRTVYAEYLNAPEQLLEPVNGDVQTDFAIDGFDDGDAAVRSRWRSSDSLNTTLGTAAVSDPAAGAGGRALRVESHGGGASDGDRVRNDYIDVRDYSGLTAIHVAVREDAGGAAPAWRVRLFDTQGRSVSAPVPATGHPGVFAAVDVPETTMVHDPAAAPGFDALHVTALELELEHGPAAAATEFDDLRAVTQSAGSALDTLMSVRITSAQYSQSFNGPTMTIYHGRDLPRPLVYTGFPPWMFRRATCRSLFDFVLGRLWGMSRQPGAAASAVERAPVRRPSPMSAFRR